MCMCVFYRCSRLLQNMAPILIQMFCSTCTCLPASSLPLAVYSHLPTSLPGKTFYAFLCIVCLFTFKCYCDYFNPLFISFTNSLPRDWLYLFSPNIAAATSVDKTVLKKTCFSLFILFHFALCAAFVKFSKTRLSNHGKTTSMLCVTLSVITWLYIYWWRSQVMHYSVFQQQ